MLKFLKSFNPEFHLKDTKSAIKNILRELKIYTSFKRIKRLFVFFINLFLTLGIPTVIPDSPNLILLIN